MPLKIVRHEDVRARKAQQTGVYVGPGGDSRYYKAGDEIAPTYRYSHARGERPEPVVTESKKG